MNLFVSCSPCFQLVHIKQTTQIACHFGLYSITLWGSNQINNTSHFISFKQERGEVSCYPQAQVLCNSDPPLSTVEWTYPSQEKWYEQWLLLCIPFLHQLRACSCFLPQRLEYERFHVVHDFANQPSVHVPYLEKKGVSSSSQTVQVQISYR